MKIDHSEKLKQFTEKLKEFPEIIGIFYSGSTATGKWDEYSDLDIDVIIRSKSYLKFVKKIPRILNLWGEVKFSNYYEKHDETYGFIDDNYLKVEINPIDEKRLNFPDYEFKDIKIIYDKTGKLKRINQRSEKLKKFHLDENYFKWNLLDTRSNLFYVATHYARGQKFEGVDEISHIRRELFKMLAKIKGMEDYDLRRTAEKNLSTTEWKFWKKSKCNSYWKREVKRSLKVCFKFMGYIEKEYEKVSKKKLNLEVNDSEIFQKVMEIIK